MGAYNDKCGHPNDWTMRLVYNGRIYTYCMGCIVETLGLDNLEAYDNPFIKLESKKVSKPKKEKKAD